MSRKMNVNDENTVMNLLNILDLSADDSKQVREEISKSGLVRFVNNVDHEQFSDEVCEKMQALSEILVLVQDDEVFHLGEGSEDYDH